MARDGRSAPDGTHDFDIETGSEVVALEVTTSANELALQAISHMSKAFTEHDYLTQMWSLTAVHPKDLGSMPDFKRMATRAGPLLSELEGLGCTEIGATLSPVYKLTGRVKEIAMELISMGVESARAIGPPAEGPGWFAVSLIGGGGWVDPEALNQAVTKECLANLKKLVASGRDKRDLFIWMDSSNFAAEFGLFLNQAPSHGPEISEGVDTVWIGLWDPFRGQEWGSRSSRLWRVRRGESWDILPVPDVTSATRRDRRREAQAPG